MKADPQFSKLDKSFWAHVRSISQSLGYTLRGKKTVRVPLLKEMAKVMADLDLRVDHVTADGKTPTTFGRQLLDYFQHRADVLNDEVQHLLMDAATAERLFKQVTKRHKPPPHLLPMNKQKGEKRAPAYLTGIVNTLVWATAGDLPFDPDPRLLTTFTADRKPVRTLARRVDGAFPAVVNPVAVWEIKEYYYTTTFGSRVADGVYETLLDGLELEELAEHAGVDVRHYLIVDARYTWWECGRAYLCRIIDMLNMGLVDEVLFGREVAERLPLLVQEWKQITETQPRRGARDGR